MTLQRIFSLLLLFTLFVGCTPNQSSAPPLVIPDANTPTVSAEGGSASAENNATITQFGFLEPPTKPSEASLLEWDVTGVDEIIITRTGGDWGEAGQQWRVPAKGSMVHTFADTLGGREIVYRLDAGEGISAEFSLAFQCENEWRFEHEEPVCPSLARESDSLQQNFENGFMILLESQSLVLFSSWNGLTHGIYENSYDPSSDPANATWLATPNGYLQPTEHFGKVWRENDDVRAALGWAIGPETPFTVVRQGETASRNGATQEYISLADGSHIFIDQAAFVWEVTYPKPNVTWANQRPPRNFDEAEGASLTLAQSATVVPTAVVQPTQIILPTPTQVPTRVPPTVTPFPTAVPVVATPTAVVIIPTATTQVATIPPTPVSTATAVPVVAATATPVVIIPTATAVVNATAIPVVNATAIPVATATAASANGITVHQFGFDRELQKPSDTVLLQWEISGVTTIHVERLGGEWGEANASYDLPARGSLEQSFSPEISGWNVTYIITSKEAPGFEHSVSIAMPCEWEWLFSFPYPGGGCPEQGIMSDGSFQTFERGFMIWVKTQDIILYSTWDGFQTNRVTDEYVHDVDLITDPSIQVPAGLYQPEYGFGKLWREKPGVRELLGWGTDWSRSYTVIIQSEPFSRYGFTEYISMNGGLITIEHPDPIWQIEYPR
ncbi:MAG: hypothetical protein ACPG8W_04500 [Candidatus Promineifilaceae bacterium]